MSNKINRTTEKVIFTFPSVISVSTSLLYIGKTKYRHKQPHVSIYIFKANTYIIVREKEFKSDLQHLYNTKNNKLLATRLYSYDNLNISMV